MQLKDAACLDQIPDPFLLRPQLSRLVSTYQLEALACSLTEASG